MREILKDLDEEDFFAIIQFSTAVRTWKRAFIQATKINVAEALAYTDTFRATGGKSKRKNAALLFLLSFSYFLGDQIDSYHDMLCVFLPGTNINDALLTAIDMLQTAKKNKVTPERTSDMIILLTDGQPNSGEQSYSVHILPDTAFTWVYFRPMHILHVSSVCV